MRENRWALCDIHGGIVTVENPNFEPCSFTNGLLRAKHISGRFVFTDFAYNNIFQRDYVWASDFSEGYALVDI